jgi:hypothetical protein
MKTMAAAWRQGAAYALVEAGVLSHEREITGFLVPGDNPYETDVSPEFVDRVYGRVWSEKTYYGRLWHYAVLNPATQVVLYDNSMCWSRMYRDCLARVDALRHMVIAEHVLLPYGGYYPYPPGVRG